MINSSIFKSYDIRGIFPDQLNENSAHQIGRGFVKHTGAKKIAIGHDARISSPKLFHSLAEGITLQGSDVYFIGMVPTECLYFTAANYDFDAGIMITASHNPKEYNGFKMLARPKPAGGEGIKKNKNTIEIIRGKDLSSAVEQNSYDDKEKGKIYEKDILQDYLNYIISFIKSDIKPFKVAIDASNGVIGQVIENLKEKLPLKITELNFEPDGNFPNHSPNPLEKGSSDQISGLIKKEKADFGIIFDGDADRVFLTNENGVLVNPDVTRLLLIKHFLSKNPGAAIVYDLICSKAVPEFILQWDGVPVKSKVGFVNIREALIKNRGVMGGEMSGHYCFKDYFYMDSGIVSFLTLLQVISSENKKISSIEKDLMIYFKADQLNFEVENKDEVLEKIKEKYADGKQDFLDGVTVEYKEWWFNIRPSNTEPLLRLTIEADTKDLLEQKKKELSNFILKYK